MNEEYQEVERANGYDAIHSHDRENDEAIPEDDVDVKVDDPGTRFALYSVLKDTRGEPGLSLENIANVILDALTREEAQSVRNELARKLDQ